MNTQKYSDLLAQWDTQIREGRVVDLKKEFRKLNFKKIPRQFLVDFAHIARRLGQPDLIITLLNPIVRSEKKLQQPATTNEKAIYGLGLFRLGAFKEAEKILESIDANLDAQIYFYKASLYMNQWNYAKAVPLLRRYVLDSTITPYQRFVGELNICASLVSLKRNKAAVLAIKKLMKKLEKTDYNLLKGNLFEIKSQLHYNLEDYDQVIKDLETSDSLLKSADLVSRLFVTKWRILTDLQKNKKSDLPLKQLADFKIKAQEFREWELVRDCDMHLALFEKNKHLLLKVYWGTFFDKYKEKILNLGLEKKIIDPDFYWEHGQTEKKIDLVELAPTKSIKLLFYFLTRDFYRPFRSTELFGLIYPDEFFNPQTSVKRLQTLIDRARRWLVSKKIPIEIKNYRNEYMIKATAPIQLKITQYFKSEDVKIDNYQRIQKIKASFSSKDFAQAFEISQRTAVRIIKELCQKHRLKMTGFGSKRRYQFVVE